MNKISNYINGTLIGTETNKYLENFNPATGKPYSLIPDSDSIDVEKAVTAAKEAFTYWGTSSLEYRYKILINIADLIEANIDVLAEAESIDNGKPLWLARKVDIPRAAENFRFFATAILHFATESHEMPNTAINYTLRQPIGIVGCISPWNLPLYLFTWKIAPALAAGNCVIAKPSEITPMTAFLLSKLCIEAGLPKGVLNIIHGTGPKVGEAIVKHPDIKAISFTGGTKTGEHIARIAAPMFKKLSLELGGKNPAIIFDDCNFDEMLDTTVRSAFLNQGEICLCTSRIYVEETIYKKFKPAFIEKVSKLKTGNPNDANNFMGAVVSKQHYEKVLNHIKTAKNEGGTVLCGGKALSLKGINKNGWFIEPTVIENLSNNCQTNQEEIFGPVATIQPFNKKDILQLANDSRYGLASTIWTQNLNLAHHIANKLNSGIVWINCWLLRDLRTPFGGMKSSGIGREGGWEALRFFTEPKNICIKLNIDE